MLYALQAILIAFAFFICPRERKKFEKCLENEVYDFGIYSLNPLRGKSAVRVSKAGIFLTRTLPWALLIVIILSNLQ